MDRQRVVRNRTIGEDLPITLMSLFGLDKLAGEIRPDELLARHARHLDGGRVDARDLSFGADRDC